MTSAPPVTAVLVVYPFCLDHVGHGNIQRILAIANDLASHGIAVDLVYQRSAQVAPVEGQYAAFRRVIAVEAGAVSSDDDACAGRLEQFYAGFEPPPRHLRPSAALTALVRALLDSESYAAVMATYAFTAPIFRDLRRRVLTICDVQDILHAHAQACLDATGQASAFALPAATEAYLWRQWDVVVAITPEDGARIRPALLPHQHLVVSRHAAPCSVSPSPGADDIALYAGSDNQSNVRGVRWLLEEVWPSVHSRRPAARLRIAGLICRAIPEPLRSTPGVDLLGFVPDLSEALSTAGVLVAPYLYGSGLKIKVVEAACAGKAVVTTRAGVVGSGLSPGRALAVADDPLAFADAIVGWLGDRTARVRVGERALAEAHALYSADACYAPIRLALDIFRRDGLSPPGHPIAPASVARVKRVIGLVGPTSVVVWGNGSHTRALVGALAEAGVRIDGIVDGRATSAGSSAEGLPVYPGQAFEPGTDTLVVLSSETFEREMWQDLEGSRRAGALVMGLAEPRLISEAILKRLPAMARAAFESRPPESPHDVPTLVLWDSLPDDRRWWRVSVLQQLAAAYRERGGQPIVVTSSRVADGFSAAGAGAAVRVLPVIELSGERVEAQAVDGRLPSLVRAAEVLTPPMLRALSHVQLRSGDLMVVIEPTLSECLALGRALDELPNQMRPSLAVWVPSSCLVAGPEAREVEPWWRLAIEVLAARVGGRLALVTPDADDAERLTVTWQRAVTPVGHPMAPRRASQVGPVARVLCVGHPSWPPVQPLLEALSHARTSRRLDVCVAWRSEQGDGRPGGLENRAPELAAELDVRLLDRASADGMEAALAEADLLVLLDDEERQWTAPLRARAEALGLPVVAPAAAIDLEACLDGLRRRPTLATAGGDTAGADAVLETLCAAARWTGGVDHLFMPRTTVSSRFAMEMHP